MKITGYVRISKSTSSTNHWITLLTKYIASSDLNPDSVEWVEDTVSGTKAWTKRKLAQVLDNSNKGDIILVGEVSRLGRDTENGLNFIKHAKAKGVIIHIASAGLIIDDSPQSITSEMMVSMLFTLAKFERDLLSQRTISGLNQAKADGKQLGGDGTDGKRIGGRTTHEKKSNVMQALRKGASINGIARGYGVSRTTVYKWKAEMEAK